METKVIWQPQKGPQEALIRCPVFEVFYGGARGGGKTDGSVGDWLEHSNLYKDRASGVFFRRTLKQLDDVIARTQELFPLVNAKWNEQKSTWTMPGGAKLRFRYLERDVDAQEYQGHSYTRVYVEEATNFPSPTPINLLRATLRSKHGVPVGMRLTGNPGGPGHNWVKNRYIVPCKTGYKVIKELVKGYNGSPDMLMERVFIPSKLRDNPLLLENDPFYVGRLRQSGSEALVKAWLEGDWDLIDGAFFDCWDVSKHVLPTSVWLSRIPLWSFRFRSMDWGFARPFCVGWYAVSDGTWGLPNGALLKYREWYGCSGMPNVGIRMKAELVARGLLERERAAQENMHDAVCDPSMMIQDGGPCIAETMAVEGAAFRRADNKRIPGWMEMRSRLIGEPTFLGWDGTPGQPMLYFLDVCKASIETIPTLQHDETQPEDLDTEGEDHAADETRYACMSRPWVRQEPVDDRVFRMPPDPARVPIRELIEARTRARLEQEQA